ncbi:MAG: Lrp/AsnC family transcriptional regulator [Ktedonobacteraceae bacterium]|nr:Lrp/AsnC family transcriptional regulator [Ktedonobacteraceae bacterium]
MALENGKLLDETGWRLLQELQQNARLSYSELGQRVGLSAPAVADRIHRLEEAGIITGYRVQLNLSKLGLPVTAIIRLGNIAGQSCNLIAQRVSEIPEVLECSRVTGSDAVIIKVAAASVTHLERVIDQLAAHGPPTTSIVLSKPIQRQVITRALVERGAEEEELPTYDVARS